MIYTKNYSNYRLNFTFLEARKYLTVRKLLNDILFHNLKIIHHENTHLNLNINCHL